MTQVYVTKADQNLDDQLSRLIDNVGLPEDLRNICIKANLNDYRRWETASTTDPYLLDRLLKILRKRYPHGSITVLENDATGVNADNIFSYLGIDTIVHKHECRYLNVARAEWKNVSLDGLHFKSIEIPSILVESDAFITFPKLKSHVKTRMTCSLKNQMGLFRPKRKITYHHILDELIVDCNLAMKPSVSLVDANLVMEGNYGPTFGSPRKLGLLVASRDVVAADSFCARLFGFSPNSISHIKKAARKGLGDTRFRLTADFDFDYKDFRLRFNPLLFRMIRVVAGGLRR